MGMEDLETRRMTVSVVRLFLLKSTKGEELPDHSPTVWQHMVGDFNFLLTGEELLHTFAVSSGQIPQAAGEYFHLHEILRSEGERPVSPEEYYLRLRRLKNTLCKVRNSQTREEEEVDNLDNFLKKYQGVLTRRIDEIRGMGCHS